MSKENEQIKNELSVFASRFAPPVLFPATVLSYNDNDATVSVKFGDAIIDDVRLRSVIKSGNKVVFVPKINSVVHIASINNSRQFVVMAVEEIDKEIVMIGTVKLQIDNTGFTIQKGSSSLKNILINIIDAVKQIVVLQGNNPDYIKLGTAETDVNNLLQ